MSKMPRPRKLVVPQELDDFPVNAENKQQKRKNQRANRTTNIPQHISNISLTDDPQTLTENSRASHLQHTNGHHHHHHHHHHYHNSGSRSQGQRASSASNTSSNKRQQHSSSHSNHHQNHPNQFNHHTHANQSTSSSNCTGNSTRRLTELKSLSNAEHINVTCRFVIRSDALISPITLNVDDPIPSKMLLRVFSPPQECPICLELAEVPRMLGCGHVMCFHCMLKHRKYSETPDICPICGEVVPLNPTRALPVTFLEFDPLLLPKEAEEVVLTLMSRRSNSAVALPVNLELQDLQAGDVFPGPDHILWTRLCQADTEYAKQQLAAEVKYLIGASKRCVAEFGFDEEGYGEAATELKKHIHSLQTNAAAASTTAAPTEYSANASKHSANKRNKSATSSTSNPTENIYFYQTAFESPVIYTLSALDVSILKSAFGSFDKLPTSLIAKISNIDFGILDRTNYKRLKFLSHIPEQTAVAYLECDWSGIIDPNVLENFRGKLLERDRLKQRKLAQEVAERQKASQAIEEQFKHEVAEAMLPHDNMNDNLFSTAIDTEHLPTLKKNSKALESLEAAKERQRNQEQEQRRQFEELMRNVYIPKRGRKDAIIRL